MPCRSPSRRTSWPCRRPSDWAKQAGPDGAAEGEASGEFLLTRCLSIAGGTTQILLNQVAEHALGLPR